MRAPNDRSYEYLRNAVLTAGPEQLQLMLLDGAIRFSVRGLEAMQHKDIEATHVALERAQRIVLELGYGLRREVNPELVDQMASLYNFVYRRLVEANIQRDARAVEEALGILRHQRETWALLIERIAQSPAPSPTRFVPSAAEPGQSAFVAEV